MRHPSTPPPRQAPLWTGDEFTPGLFGTRWPGGNDPRRLAAPDGRADRPRGPRALSDVEVVADWRLRTATAEAYGHRRPA